MKYMKIYKKVTKNKKSEISISFALFRENFYKI